jgi:hypothetical protein
MSPPPRHRTIQTNPLQLYQTNQTTYMAKRCELRAKSANLADERPNELTQAQTSS